MEDHYQTLSAIYDIVKSDPSPQTYLCTPHQIILRHTQDWQQIQKHLELLALEKLVSIRQLDKFSISITGAGMAKAKALKNNFVNNHFTFSNDNKHLSLK